MIYVAILAGVVLACLFVLLIDLFFPKITKYEFSEAKIHDALSMIVLSDLHGRTVLMSERKSIRRIRECKPDLILLAGDMITTRQIHNYESTCNYLEQLSKIAPVYYSLGNHEQKALISTSKYYENGQFYLNKLKDNPSIQILDNQTALVKIKNSVIHIHGLSLPTKFFIKKPKNSQPLPDISQFLGESTHQDFNILLAHHPKYMKQYVEWGADYIFAGHYHGGILRLPFFGGVISPEFQLFPKYSGGDYHFGTQHGIVSRGIGIHTFPVRFLNRSQIIHVKLVPCIEKPKKIQ